MTSKATTKRAGKSGQPQRRTAGGKAGTRPTRSTPAPRRWGWLAAVVAVALAVGGLYAVFRNANDGGSGSGGSGYAFQVGQPGPGATAPTFTLASSTGGQLDLASLRGKTVLLYFQEGLSCQPCWDQITDLEKQAAAVKAAGVDQIVSITTDPIDLIARKTQDMGLSTPVLSDPDLAVSKQYDANSYGMMGTSRDGHTFVLVRPDGTIGWRADYGGAHKYTMLVPVDGLVEDLRAGTGQGSGQ